MHEFMMMRLILRCDFILYDGIFIM